MKRLEDKVMLVTGASSDIGTTTALLAAKEGATVVVTDSDYIAAEDVATMIGFEGGHSVAFKLDTHSKEDWKKVISKVLIKYERIDSLVNHADTTTPKTILELGAAEWEEMEEIDRDNYIYAMHQVIPSMQTNGGGSIINISTIAGLEGLSGPSPYQLNKGIMDTHYKEVATNFGKDNIRINTIQPGVIETPIALIGHADSKKNYKKFTQLPHFGRAEDIAYGVIYLASDEASFVTGSNLVIDGGWTTS